MDEHTRDELIRMFENDEQPGYCTNCGSIDNPAESDQDVGYCEDCGENCVKGMEYLLLMWT